MPRFLRPLLPLCALLLLGASVYVLLDDDRFGVPLLAYLHRETPEQRQSREAADRQADLVYAARLRADGVARVLGQLDYENGKTRLDQAAAIDPDSELDPKVIEARNWMRATALIEAHDAPPKGAP